MSQMAVRPIALQPAGRSQGDHQGRDTEYASRLGVTRAASKGYADPSVELKLLKPQNIFAYDDGVREMAKLLDQNLSRLQEHPANVIDRAQPT